MSGGGMLYQRPISVPDGVPVELLLQKWNPDVPDYAIEDMLVSVLRWNGLRSFDELRPNQEILIPTIVPPGLTPREWRKQQKDRPRRQPFQIGGAKFDSAPEPEPPPLAAPNVAPLTAAPGRQPAGLQRALPAAWAQKPGGGAMPSVPAAASAGASAARAPAQVPPRPPTPVLQSRSSPGISLIEMQLRQKATAGPWQAGNRAGEALAGSEVKEQFQKQMADEIWKKRAMARKF